RLACIEALGCLAPLSKDALPALLGVFSDRDLRVRRRAIWAGGQFGPYARKAVPALRAAPEGTKTAVDAPRARGNLGADAEAALPDLIASLKRKDVRLRNAIAYALGHIGPRHRDVIPTLLDLVRESNEAPVRLAATYSLGRIGLPAHRANVLLL